MPRLTSWHGDPGCSYAYSGRLFHPAPWTPELAALRDRLIAAEGCAFNSVLVNHYRDGADSMGEHADDEPELGPSRDDVRIASISLGAPRRFVLRHRRTRRVHAFAARRGKPPRHGGTTQRLLSPPPSAHARAYRAADEPHVPRDSRRLFRSSAVMTWRSARPDGRGGPNARPFPSI